MNLRNVFIFIGGVGLGAVSTYFLMKDRCDRLVEEETSSIKKYYEDKYATEKKEVEKEKKKKKKKEKEVEKEEDYIDPVPDSGMMIMVDANEKGEPDYNQIIQKLNYNEFSTKTSENKKAKRPYIISEEEYIEDTKYIKKIISCFEDDMVCMDNDTKEILENVAKDIGQDCIETLNEDGNEIYVRNEILGIDYNVVSEPGSYEDFIDE